MRLLLIRHGHTADNGAHVYAGQRDTPLSALGELHAQALSERLAAAPLAAIFTSDLARARATADLIAAPHGLAAQRSAELRELAMGAWEGKTYARLVVDEPERLAGWIRDPAHNAPPGGESAEAMRQRVCRALTRQIDEFSERTVAWITHGGVIGVLLCSLLGIPIAQRWRLQCEVASISTLDVFAVHDDTHDGWDGSIHSLNDRHHLTALPGTPHE